MQSVNNKNEVILEMTPNFLIYCSRHLPKNIRNEFPILLNLDLNSDKWIDELQTLNSDKISVMENEIERIYRIINKLEFIPNVESEKILKFWTTDEYNINEINKNINELKSFFKKSNEQNLEVNIYL